MLRTRVVLLVLATPALICVVACPPAAADAARAAKKKKLSCKRLTGTDLAPAKDVKLVRRRNRELGTDLLGCVRPNGKVRRVARSEDHDGHGDEDYSLKQVAGGTVLLSTSFGSQYGGGKNTSVFNIRTGKAYKLASSCYEVLTGFCAEPGSAAQRALVNDRGQAAAAILSGQTATIAAFSSTGTRTNLDSGTQAEVPPASLNLTGGTVTWTHSGEQRSAQISG